MRQAGGIALTAELGRAREGEKLEAKMDAATAELRATGPAKVANSDARALQRYLAAVGVEIGADRLNDLLVLLAVLMMEAGGGLSLAIGMALSSPVAGPPAAAANATTVQPEQPRTPPAPALDATADASGACRATVRRGVLAALAGRSGRDIDAAAGRRPWALAVWRTRRAAETGGVRPDHRGVRAAGDRPDACRRCTLQLAASCPEISPSVQGRGLRIFDPPSTPPTRYFNCFQRHCSGLGPARGFHNAPFGVVTIGIVDKGNIEEHSLRECRQPNLASNLTGTRVRAAIQNPTHDAGKSRERQKTSSQPVAPASTAPARGTAAVAPAASSTPAPTCNSAGCRKRGENAQNQCAADHAS